MQNENIILKNPLVTVFICLILGSIVYNSSFNLSYIILSIITFIIIFWFGGKKSTIIFFLFFLLIISSNHFYYSIPKVNDGRYIVRITNQSYGKFTGIYKGRKVIIQGSKLSFNIGSKYLISGDFTPSKEMDKGIVGIIYGGDYKQEKRDLISFIYDYKEGIYKKIESKLGKESAAMISAVSFGYVDGLTLEQKNDMKYWGLIHIISVSGFHMALIYKLLEKLFGYKVALITCAFYTLFTGASSATLRSFLMILILKIGEKIYKEYNPISSLSLSGILICLITPYSPLDLGFQLSYLATLGIILFNTPLNKKFYKYPKYLREAMAISISPQVLTYPIVGISIGYFSVNSLLTNLVLMPFFSVVVILGNLLLLTYWWNFCFDILVGVTGIINGLINLMLNFMEIISLPLMNIERELVYYYIICLGCYYFIKKGFNEFKYIPIVLLIPLSIYIYSPITKINISNGKDIRVSYKGDIWKYRVTNSKVSNISNTQYKNKSIIPLNSVGDSFYINNNIFNIRTNNKKVYRFSLIKNKEKYDIITLREDETIFILGDKVIRF
ncbi:ComEC/Rec2 family competence protein [Clostridium paridis]|uniref:ComEC/Rec2 family competence protein n=1 Tax=Clostridium paridis TaxID=2803863 RepID=A0A937FJX6_9CLOT|nr:ComEC/Rec2 family competence protein [Clostridium paridis]